MTEPRTERRKPRSAARAGGGLALADRPGFLIRRLHQIHVALFLEECAPFGITPVQYSVMTALEREGPLDQVSLGEAVGIDRANGANVVRRLEERGLLRRQSHAADSRLKVCSLTSTGRALTRRMLAAVERAHARTIESLPRTERAAFVASLRRLVESNNELGRTRLRLR